jgi:hypothetical protein
MKHFTKQLAIVSLSLLASAQVYASGAQLPNVETPTTTGEATQETTPPTTGGGTTSPTTPTPTKPSTGTYIEHIKDMVTSSSCASYSWSDRGRAPAGYIKGMAITFARGYCRMKKADSVSAVMSMASTGNTTKDAVAYYSSVFAPLSFQITTKGAGPLRALYTLGMGLGMRESSGSYCEGWDRSAGSNRTSAEAEAGLFQTSYDSMAISSELPKLYASYKAGEHNCLLSTFKEGVSCSSSSTLGTGAGADYQVFNKACPAFAAEYAMTMLRVARSHYGPIIRKEAQVNASCGALLTDVQNLIESDEQAACDEIL